MYSVTQRTGKIKQPRGGYIPPRSFDQIKLEDSFQLNQEENIHSSLIGLAVDYLTRYTMGAKVDDAFKVSFLGAKIIGMETVAVELSKKITGLDDVSITSACKLVGFDVCFRVGTFNYKPIEDIIPNQETIEDIRLMVNRSEGFFKEYGPLTKDGFTFEGAYTSVVSSGDGDFLTEDTLWDFKVSKRNPTPNHTLQIVMYYLMGKKSIHKDFEKINKIGFYNPRLNIVYLLKVNDISQETIKLIESDVIGY